MLILSTKLRSIDLYISFTQQGWPGVQSYGQFTWPLCRSASYSKVGLEYNHDQCTYATLHVHTRLTLSEKLHRPWMHLLHTARLTPETKLWPVYAPASHSKADLKYKAMPSLSGHQLFLSSYLCISFSSVFSKSRITLFFRLSNSIGPLALQQ